MISDITISAGSKIKTLKKRDRTIAGGRPSRRTTERKYPTGVVKAGNRFAARITLEDYYVDAHGDRLPDNATASSTGHRRRYLHLGTRSTIEEAQQLYRDGKAFYDQHGYVVRSDIRKVRNNRIVWKQFYIETPDSIAQR